MEPESSAQLRTPVRSAIWLVLVLLAATACSAGGSKASPTDLPQLSSPSNAGDPSPQAPGDLLTAPTATDLLGRWKVISVAGHKPPRRALPFLKMSLTGRRYYADWDDGLNAHSMRWWLTADGTYRKGLHFQTVVGCFGKCTRPSGFGVVDASVVRLTKSGRLVFLSAEGVELALYRRLA